MACPASSLVFLVFPQLAFNLSQAFLRVSIGCPRPQVFRKFSLIFLNRFNIRFCFPRFPVGCLKKSFKSVLTIVENYDNCSYDFPQLSIGFSMPNIQVFHSLSLVLLSWSQAFHSFSPVFKRNPSEELSEVFRKFSCVFRNVS